jgi:hypothetical protein
MGRASKIGGPTSGYCGQARCCPSRGKLTGPRSLAPWQLQPKPAPPTINVNPRMHNIQPEQAR